MDMGGCVWVAESFLRNDRWQNYSVNFFPINIWPFTNDSNSKNNNLYGFENSQMDMAGCVSVGESFLRKDKW